VLASGALRARGGEPRGAAERPTVSDRAAGPARGENRGGREEKKELTRGVGLAERERERGESGVRWEKKGRRQAGPSWQREKGKGSARGGRLREKVGRPTRGGEGEGESWAAGEGEEREKGNWAGPRVWVGLPSFIPFPFLYSNIQTNIICIQINLDSNPTNSTQEKIMLQHECTNNLIL
jgi:hypothetical protein